MTTRLVRSTAAAFLLALTFTESAALADDIKVPQTVEDHQALAKQYEEQAAAWRKEAAYHREMAAAYKKANPDLKGGIARSDAVKMEKHCMAIVGDVEKAAVEAEDAAKYHRHRAKELQGQ